MKRKASREAHREAVVAAAEFKAKCLAILKAVERDRRSFIVTKRGKPVARVIPLGKAGSSLLGSLLYEEDVMAPVDADWEALR